MLIELFIRCTKNLSTCLLNDLVISHRCSAFGGVAWM